MFGSCDGSPQRDLELAQAGRTGLAVRGKAIAAGQMAGTIRAGDPLQLAQVAWSLVHGIAMLTIDGYLLDPSAAATQELTALATRSLVAGLQVPADAAAT